MKRKLLFAAMLAIVGALSMNVQAQSWTASEVGEGYAILYNVGKGKYLTRGNDYQTRASVGDIEAALIVSLEAVNNSFKIRTQPSKGLEYLDSNTVYTD